MSKRISITLPEDMHKFLSEYKRVSGTSMSAKIKDLIANWIVTYDQQPSKPYIIVQRDMTINTTMKTVQRDTGTHISPVMSSEIKNEFKKGIAKRIKEQESKQNWSELENIDELRGVSPDLGN